MRKVLLLASGLALGAAFPASADQGSSLRLEVGGGFDTALDQQHRRDFGGRSLFTAGIASAISDGDTWVVFEAGYGQASGHPNGTDPTYERTEAKYWWAPIALGFRSNLVPKPQRKSVALHLGFYGVVAPVRYAPPLGASNGTATIGGLIELRPSVGLGKGLRLWLRERLALLTQASFVGPNAPELDLSGYALEVGFSHELGTVGR
jgi:hypothetical protein